MTWDMWCGNSSCDLGYVVWEYFLLLGIGGVVIFPVTWYWWCGNSSCDLGYVVWE